VNESRRRRRNHTSPLLRFAAFAGLGLGALSWSSAATATVVERVVAVVGEKAILLSELRERASPFMTQISQRVPEGASRNAAVSQLYQQLVQKLVDDELLQRAATNAHISVTGEEIDQAVGRVASQNNVSTDKLYEEAAKSGLSSADYRQEIRRQLLEAKLLNLRIQGRLRISEDDMRTAYKRSGEEERRTLKFQAAWIQMPIDRSGGALAASRVQETASKVANEARAGGDFATLAKRYSADDATKDQGGLLPELAPGQLPQELDQALLALEPGGVTGPVRVGDAYVVVKLVERAPSTIPAYDEAKPILQNRVYAEKMEKARRQWLDSLRRRTHVDVRL
jgi:peptidyl-prolyl cis-trans isomerase SurA